MKYYYFESWIRKMTISRDRFIAEVQKDYPTYQPNPETLARMSAIGLTLVTGPAGSGKSTVMAETKLPRVVSDTIRDPRTNDGVIEIDGREYFFRGNQLDETLAGVRGGNYVQYALGPSRTSFYGSRAASYPEEGAALMDVVTASVPGMQELPFGRVTPVAVIAPSHNEWIRRLDGRGTLDADDRAARIVEARQSLGDAIEGNYQIVVNRELGAAAKTLLLIAKNKELSQEQQEDGRKTAEEMHRELTRAI